MRQLLFQEYFQEAFGPLLDRFEDAFVNADGCPATGAGLKQWYFLEGYEFCQEGQACFEDLTMALMIDVVDVSMT